MEYNQENIEEEYVKTGQSEVAHTSDFLSGSFPLSYTLNTPASIFLQNKSKENKFKHQAKRQEDTTTTPGANTSSETANRKDAATNATYDFSDLTIENLKSTTSKIFNTASPTFLNRIGKLFLEQFYTAISINAESHSLDSSVAFYDRISALLEEYCKHTSPFSHCAVVFGKLTNVVDRIAVGEIHGNLDNVYEVLKSYMGSIASPEECQKLINKLNFIGYSSLPTLDGEIFEEEHGEDQE